MGHGFSAIAPVAGRPVCSIAARRAAQGRDIQRSINMVYVGLHSCVLFSIERSTCTSRVCHSKLLTSLAVFPSLCPFGVSIVLWLRSTVLERFSRHSMS